MTIISSLDAATLLRKKKSLRRELLTQQGLLEKRIAILGGSTTDEVSDILELCLLARGIKPEFYQSGYNQYFSEALQPEKALQQFQPELVYIHTSNANINTFPAITDSRDDVQTLYEQQLAHFTSTWNGIRQHLACPVVQNNFDEPWHRPLGNLDGSDYRGKSRFISRLNEAFANAAEQRNDLYIHDIHYLSARMGTDQWFNPRQWYLYKYAMDIEAIVQLSRQLAGVISSIFGLTKKCLVLDLDNTLWGGTIGDDGIEGIAIGNASAEAEAHSEFQRYALALKQRGILLAVCSKNDAANALAGFSHSESTLQQKDFSAFYANWENKPDNILHISKELNISTDSLVFFDDNPVERDLMRQQLPDVSVPEAGSDVTEFIRALEKTSLFETSAISENDALRSQQYNENRNRQSQESTFTNYADFLCSLDMRAVIEPFNDKNLERITQLTNKTNQFNLTTRRYTITEIKTIADSSSYITLSGWLTDKYGDNGLVSAIAGRIENDTLHIDLWLMSCRVFKRGLELVMMQEICTLARQKNLKLLIGYYLPTAKNSIVANLYHDLGLTLQSDADDKPVWLLDLSKNPEFPHHFISVNGVKKS